MKNEIEKFATAKPFVKFEIVLVGGRVFGVKHPEFIYLPPGKGLFFVYTHPDGTPETCNAMLVESVRPMRNGKHRKAS